MRAGKQRRGKSAADLSAELDAIRAQAKKDLLALNVGRPGARKWIERLFSTKHP